MVDATQDIFYRPPDLRLSQGDILTAVPHAYLKPPLSVLRSMSTRQGQMLQPFEFRMTEEGSVDAVHNAPTGGFKLSSAEGDQIAATGQVGRGIVLTHDCEIDKPSLKYVWVALVRPLRMVPIDNQQIIRDNSDFSAFYLPAIGDAMEESFVDFRRTSCVHVSLVPPEFRLASLTPSAVNQLLVKLMLFITRADLNALETLVASRVPAEAEPPP